MVDETRALISVPRPERSRRRVPHRLLRRFCTIALSSILIWGVLSFTITLLIAPEPGDPRDDHDDGDSRRARWSWPGCKERKVSHEKLVEMLLETPSPDKAEAWSRYYTSGPHLAGQNFSQAAWTRDKWEEFGVRSEVVSYDAYLNYPVDHRLALLEAVNSSDGSSEWKISFQGSLTEDILEEDATSGLVNSIPTFHGYSASGNVTGPLVYVNYGTYQDYEDLVKANVSLAGKIAIARYGGIFRGLKVKRAQELGMSGVILYSDPGDDGEMTEEKGEAQYPHGRARQASSVQRGSVEFLSIAPGDPTTPGYPSKPGVPRKSADVSTPSIPSIPISYADALPLLKALNGHGPRSDDFSAYWTRKQGLGYKGVGYYIGPTPDHVAVNLYNEQRYTITPLWNVIGIINGSIPDEVVVVGNHRDAWIAGGAGDPNSGSAVLNEVVRGFGRAVAAGWKPLRTIVFASWDGEEYSLIGSTEWVEEYLPWLSSANVAYLNVDIGVGGRRFSASAAPLLNNVIYAATAAVASPNQTLAGQSVRDLWDGRIRTMGSGSDFTAFQDHAGVPCIHVEFTANEKDPVYHYHSNYDSFAWMQKYGDPGFQYHRTMAQILGLMTAQLSDVPVLSFRAGDYAKALKTYVKKVEDKLTATPLSIREEDISCMSDEAVFEVRARDTSSSVPASGHSTDRSSLQHGFDRLYRAVQKLEKKATRLDKHASELDGRTQDEMPWWQWPGRLKLALQIRKVNSKYKLLERTFLYAPGLDGRSWFKHVIFAPGLWTGYSGAVFPGLVESIDAEEWERALKWVGIIEDCIQRAARAL